MDESRIVAVDHVELESPAGLIDELRWFYGQLCELEEIPLDGQSNQLLVYKSGQIELRINEVDEAIIKQVDRRVTILVKSLFDVEASLVEKSISLERIRGIGRNDRRLEVLDPAGYRVALKQMSTFGIL